MTILQVNKTQRLLKTINLSNYNTCLEDIWRSSDESEPSSPPSPIQSNSFDIFSLLSNQSSKNRKGSLYVSPFLEKPQSIISKKKPQKLLFSSFVFTSAEDPKLDEFIEQQLIYIYNGNDNKTKAWDDVKKNLRRFNQMVINITNYSFYFNKDRVTCKGKTSSASKELENLSHDLPNIDKHKAIALIDKLILTESMSIYSSSPFLYSTITPLSFERTEMETMSGKL